jgi:hypothetical protein
MEGGAQAWWDTLPIGTQLIMDLQSYASSSTPIDTWEVLCQALRRRFYPPDYRQNLLAR